MDFRKLRNLFTVLAFVSFTAFFIIGCSDNEKANVDNTYYLELVNFTKDSLKQSVSDNIFGKVAYYDENKKLQIVSMNYVTDGYPDMHYLKNADGLDKEIKPDTKKIRIEFGGEYSVDSIRYSLQKYIYKNNGWVKTSDMGFLKATTTYKKAKEYAIKEFGKEISIQAILYTFN